MKTPKPAIADQSFDKISEKFTHSIYSTGKGKIRQAILTRDLHAFIHSKQPLRVLDVGGGQGQMAEAFVKAGHEVVLNDISPIMLDTAKQRWQQTNIDDSKVTYLPMPLQQLATIENLGKFDLVMCHAVFEWLAKPRDALVLLTQWIKPEGAISLMYFNKDALRFGNILYGNFDYVKAGLKVKKKVAMNPNNPLPIATVQQWISEMKLQVIQHSGVRCFHDYIKRESQADWLEELLEMELTYAHLEPYRSLGKYQHLILGSAQSR